MDPRLIQLQLLQFYHGSRLSKGYEPELPLTNFPVLLRLEINQITLLLPLGSTQQPGHVSQ